jgi:hypothetical protein
MTDPATRDCSKNAGFISLEDIDPTKYIVGVVVVLYDEDGNYSSEWRPVSMDEIPGPEAREDIGALVSGAFELANMPGIEQ